MTKHLLDVTAEIAALVVADVTILDVSGIPDAVTLRAGDGLLYPEPVDFVSGITVTRQSLGPNGSAYLDMSYTLTYTYCHAPIGSGRGIKDYYAALTAKAQAIVFALARHEWTTDGVTVAVTGVSGYGTVPDPSYSGGENTNGLFYGFRLTVGVTEFMEV